MRFDHCRHVQHCNVNCADLERSLTFYRGLGFETSARTTPEPQDGAGFGLPGDAAWDAWMLSDGRSNPVIDLLEWKVPTPTGAPHVHADALGMIALRLATPTVDAPTEVTDPDGTRLRLEPADHARFRGVVINVADLDESARWYVDTLGFERRDEATGGAPILGFPGDEFEIRLEPGDPDRPAYPSANHLGIYRMAFLVDDAAAAVESLRATGAECPDAVFLDMGPTLPIDGLWAAFFPDPDGTCLEFIESPAQRP